MKTGMHRTRESLVTQPIGRLTPGEFNKLSAEIFRICGIQLPDSKISLVEGRVRRRVKALGLASFGQYIEYLFSDAGAAKELTPLIDAVTTNKTDFFREKAHFDYLVNTVLPELDPFQRSNFSVWSAGCSTGEEPYTLAFILNEYFTPARATQFTIYASDISMDVLKRATEGVYPAESAEVIPLELKKKYLLKSKNSDSQLVRICPEVRRQVNFIYLNFMSGEYDVPGNLDAVFCRNVLIYFNKGVQEQVLSRICEKIRSGGYLFLGHSESVMGMSLPLERVAATIYRKV